MSAMFPSQLRPALMRWRYFSRRHPEQAGYDWSSVSETRVSIIRRAVSLFGTDKCRYLEIGCAENTCFNAISAGMKVGVDPAQGGTVRATSDEFFRTNTQTFDVIFIDGLHTYEQARRDAVNGLGSLATGGLMLFHDMLPNSWEEEAPRPVVSAWTGDVWKLGVDLARTEGIEYRTIVADHGVGVLRKDRGRVELPAMRSPDRRKFADFLNSRGRMNLIRVGQYPAFLTALRSTEP